MVQFSAQSTQSTQLSEGYAAFNRANADENDPNWSIVEELFCEDRPNSDQPEFPVWYAMDGERVFKGRQAILGHLQSLRADKTKATLLGVGDHGNKSITLDITLGGTEGPHACADLVEFDESGRITLFRHCSTATHEHGQGPPEGNSDPPSA
ncbi:MAG: hypothetical protein QOE80_2674 [Actinomycetota bacterium]|jgi:hypothetical protein|nr:hypothetical protein [Actinomycetota bacterium]MEA2589976.1 hypothetical protein [Actinomycetota bacterium]